MNSEPKIDPAYREELFNLMCKAKRGITLTQDEFMCIIDAHKKYPQQYKAMGPEVFRATLPFGARVYEK